MPLPRPRMSIEPARRHSLEGEAPLCARFAVKMATCIANVSGAISGVQDDLAVEVG
jgi:hypothetical protein